MTELRAAAETFAEEVVRHRSGLRSDFPLEEYRRLRAALATPPPQPTPEEEREAVLAERLDWEAIHFATPPEPPSVDRERIARAIHNELGEACDHRNETMRRWQCRVLADAAIDTLATPEADRE